MNKATHTAVYPQQMRPSRYDRAHFLVYLNESSADYYPNEETTTPLPGFSYTGTMEDGGTLIECDDLDRNKLINGIIRSRYLQTEEDAIKTHQIQLLQFKAGLETGAMTDEKIAEYAQEWADFQAFREETIRCVDKWLEV